MKFLRTLFAICHKDLLQELRNRNKLNTIFFFGVLITFLFSFAFGNQPSLLKTLAPGLLWLTTLFSSLLALKESFETETNEYCLDRLVLYASNLRAVFLGKIVTNFIFITLIQIVVLFFMFILFDLGVAQNASLLLANLFLVNVGIATLGTFYSSLVVNVRAREVLLPLLLFPMLIPLLLAAVMVTQAALFGDVMGESPIWLKVILIFDLVFFSAGLLISETLLET